MSNPDFTQMMNELTAKEEKKLGVNSPEFLQRHNDIMNDCNKKLLKDLMMEQRETM